MPDLRLTDQQPACARRGALKLGLAATASLAMPTLGRATTRMLDPDKPDDARLIYRKLRYRTDDGLIFSWLKGPYMAVIEGDLIPMYAINLGSLSRVTQRADGGFDLRDLEMSFRTDVDTGERLTRFRNPVTGETLPVVERVQGPNRLTISRDNQAQISDRPGGPHFDLTHYPVRPFTIGHDIAIRDRTHARVTGPDGVSLLNEVSTISGPRAQVLDPSVTSVASRAQSNDVRSYPAWLRMGERPGHLVLFGNGGKVHRFTDLPEDWRAMLHEVFPAIAADPVAALDKA
ncbi:MAG: DUF1838 family protein [Sphingomonadales bacterium]|nr:DUF1838 family protein [Sphingomonadales bacterium]MDE2170932.1 DUF1838 family protein [Sphingomonadales bacterium]